MAGLIYHPNYLDLIIGLITLTYIVLGWKWGLIRRLLGIAGIYLALMGGTIIAPSAGSYLYTQYLFGWKPVTDNIFAYFLIVLVILVAIEALGFMWHDHLQIAVVPGNSLLGGIAGLIGAFLLLAFLTVMCHLAIDGVKATDSSVISWLSSQLDYSWGARILGVFRGLVEFIFHPAVPPVLDHFFSGNPNTSPLGP